MSSEYIRWAIATPLEIYSGILSSYLDGADAAFLGASFNKAIESWVAEIPITDMWASLPYRKLMAELKVCDKILFRSENNQIRFRNRLLEKYGDITSIQRAMKVMSV